MKKKNEHDNVHIQIMIDRSYQGRMEALMLSFKGLKNIQSTSDWDIEYKYS